MALNTTPPRLRAATTAGPASFPALALDWGNGQTGAVGASSVSTTAYNSPFDTVFRLTTNANCWYTVGASPTAVAHAAGTAYLAAGATHDVYVPAGFVIAVIQDGTSSGFFSAVPALVTT